MAETAVAPKKSSGAWFWAGVGGLAVYAASRWFASRGSPPQLTGPSSAVAELEAQILRTRAELERLEAAKSALEAEP